MKRAINSVGFIRRKGKLFIFVYKINKRRNRRKTRIIPSINSREATLALAGWKTLINSLPSQLVFDSQIMAATNEANAWKL